MSGLARQRWCAATLLLVPLLSLGSQALLQLAGVGPSWAVLWLLPWSLVDGPWSGMLAGLMLGLMLDALQLGPVSQIPALLLLGWWWGRLGRRHPRLERSFNLGLLALLGTALLGLSVMLQQHLAGQLGAAPLHVLMAQTLLTALLAPMLCSLQLLLWRLQVPGLRSDVMGGGTRWP
ncbi:rod shape-determining protein MreD [Cyanobium sp. LEGE 06143]|uniref:rod shape-determining protein MreD n=1 Tax=Cyanobium sp. LEGE 06143 TaxID=945727 RepID=UPI00187F6F76|nr:rod shape-determining protein MreD [Cyanobium sp. LEGE 06143]MBE9173773.1 rod shape-determining protein MreD [Cyanobium sp. LEGE 06143]